MARLRLSIGEQQAASSSSSLSSTGAAAAPQRTDSHSTISRSNHHGDVVWPWPGLADADADADESWPRAGPRPQQQQQQQPVVTVPVPVPVAVPAGWLGDLAIHVWNGQHASHYGLREPRADAGASCTAEEHRRLIEGEGSSTFVYRARSRSMR